MANDRVYIRCNVCDEDKLMIKYYPRGSYVWEGDVSLDDWLENHLECLEKDFGHDLNGESNFQIITESKKC